MIELEAFLRAVGGLNVGQEALIYPDGKQHVCARFLACEEYERKFTLFYDCANMEFGVVQDTTTMSSEEQIRLYYDDLVVMYDKFHVSLSAG